MATLGDLRQRVATEMDREDLNDELYDTLTLHISRAIEYYQGEPFYFNYGSVTDTATSGNPEMSMPATMRVIDKITISAEVIEKRPLEDILTATASSGTPEWYSEFGDGVYFYPTPSSALTVKFFGTKYITPPSAESDSTVWTNAAYDLINAHVQMTLYRDVFRDADGTTTALAAVTDAKTRLDRETSRRNATPLRPPAHFPMPGYSAYP